MSETGSPYTNDKGTTLVEALVVVAITGLIAFIGFPAMRQSLLGMAQHQTAALVAARLRQLRADALRADRVQVFAIAADGQRYGASGSPPVNTPRGVTLASSSVAIEFFGDGSSTGGSVLVIAGAHRVPIDVAADTGAVWIGGT